jgi:hypothetical protein
VSAASDYSRWSARDWAEHYTGARFDPRYAEVGSLWDRQGRPMPLFQSGQSLAFDGAGLAAAREFPIGFYDPAVPPVCFPATPAIAQGTVNLITNIGLYGAGGTLHAAHATLSTAIDGAAPVMADLAAPVVNTPADLINRINAAIEPGAVASIDPVTEACTITTTSDGPGSSLLLTGLALGLLGLPATLITGEGTTPGVAAVPVISRSQLRVFRGARLVIPSDIAPNFSLLDVKIGNRSQLANSVAIPAETFVEGAVGVRLRLSSAVTAMDIALVVANQTSGTLPFRATLIGSTFAF